MTLINKFSLIGTLSEIRVDLYSSHIKVKMAVNIYDYIITVYSTISRKFNLDKYQNLIEVMGQLNPRSDGWIYLNGKEQYEKIYSAKDQPISKLLIVGNLSPSKDRIFFNMEYMKVVNETRSDGLSISIEGQFVDKGKYLNVVCDNPRVFNLPIDKKAKIGQMYLIDFKYAPEYRYKDRIIESIEQDNQLVYYKVTKSNKVITKEDLEEYLLEWEIIGGD